MEQLIFLAVIIVLSLLESIARGRKQRQGGQQLPGPEWEWEAETPPAPTSSTSTGGATTAGRTATVERGEEWATYDQDRSYDERTVAESATTRDELEVYEQLRARREREAEQLRRSSETLIPDEIWQEIERRRRPETKLPAKRSETKRPAARAERQPRSRQPARRPAEQRAPSIHLAHADYATDPSTRVQPPLELTRPPTGKTAAGVRRELRSGPGAIRRAMVLQEVLGPPAALRGERFDPFD